MSASVRKYSALLLSDLARRPPVVGHCVALSDHPCRAGTQYNAPPPTGAAFSWIIQPIMLGGVAYWLDRKPNAAK